MFLETKEEAFLIHCILDVSTGGHKDIEDKSIFGLSDLDFEYWDLSSARKQSLHHDCVTTNPSSIVDRSIPRSLYDSKALTVPLSLRYLLCIRRSELMMFGFANPKNMLQH